MEEIVTKFPFWAVTTIIGGLLTIIGILITVIVKRFHSSISEAMAANTVALDGVKESNTKLANAIELIIQDTRNMKKEFDGKHQYVTQKLSNHSGCIKDINNRVSKHEGWLESNTDDIKILKEKHLK